MGAIIASDGCKSVKKRKVVILLCAKLMSEDRELYKGKGELFKCAVKPVHAESEENMKYEKKKKTILPC